MTRLSSHLVAPGQVPRYFGFVASFSWTWKSGLLEGVGNVVLAYFCGLPSFPYELESQTPFKFTFVRGKRSVGLVDDFHLGDLRTKLIVTCRPTAHLQVEWSFKHEVFSAVYEFSVGDPIPKLQRFLSDEIDGFFAYYRAFESGSGQLPSGG